MYNALLIYFIVLIIAAIALLALSPRFHIKNPVKFFALICAGIAIPIIVGYIFLAYIYPIPQTIVPDVVGLTEKEAITRIERLDLSAKIESRDNSSNLVSSQRPEPGKIVKVGRVVVLSIGKQGKDIPLPNEVVVSPLLTGESNPTPGVTIEIINGGSTQ